LLYFQEYFFLIEKIKKDPANCCQSNSINECRPRFREKINNSIKEKLKERSDRIKPLLSGEKAPNLNLIDTADSFRSFREINADYTLLLFWDLINTVIKYT